MSIAPQEEPIPQVPSGVPSDGSAAENLLYASASLQSQAESDTKYDVKSDNSGNNVESFDSEPALVQQSVSKSFGTVVGAFVVAGLAVTAALIGLTIRKR